MDHSVQIGGHSRASRQQRDALPLARTSAPRAHWDHEPATPWKAARQLGASAIAPASWTAAVLCRFGDGSTRGQQRALLQNGRPATMNRNAAEWHPAGSQIGNPLPLSGPQADLAGCQSATEQVRHLPYPAVYGRNRCGIRALATALVALILLLLCSGTAEAQVRVRTLGGGRTIAQGRDAGYVDGNTLQASQFNFPAGIAVDAARNLLVADKNNGALRKLDLSASRASTILSGLNRPVAVAVDSTNNVYVLTQGDGAVRRIDAFGAVANVATGLSEPTALAAGRGALYVTEQSGRIQRVDLATRTASVIVQGLNQPAGIAVLDSGLLAVSETGAHRVRLIHPATGRTEVFIGTGVAGFRNGSSSTAQFNQPHQIARAPNGTLVVADRGNHRARLISPDGNVTTLYGIDPAAWEGPECLDCTPIILPGWFDGVAEFAEAREPVGVAVSADGRVYTTEVFYHLVREITGAALTAGTGEGGSGPAIPVLPPRITPDSGYFPLGQDIAVTNPNTNAFFSSAIFYTTDGSTPTTNSTRLELNGSTGTIRWRETTRDLTSLKLVAVVGGTVSEIVSGKPAATNEIGVTRDLTAGPGSTAIVPVTVNLRPADKLQSLQFRVEVAPAAPGLPMVSEQFRPLSISTNDFIRLATSAESEKTARFSAAAYAEGANRGLAITFIGSEANLAVERFAAVAMLAVPIPGNAPLGGRYVLRVIAPSGTADAAENAIALATMPPREIVVAETGYVVGDSAPASWYNAERAPSADMGNGADGYGFGDGRLNNNDVNNAFAASLGVRVPYPFSDLFDAMDAFPEDSAADAGGDGLIRFLDWQVILIRSLGLDPDVWQRKWAGGGFRVAARTMALRPNSAADSLNSFSGEAVWQPQAAIVAGVVENAEPGAAVNIPVWVTTLPNCALGGIAFRATLESDGSAPPLVESIQFNAASGVVAPVQAQAPAKNVLLCGWPLVPAPSFRPALEGQKLLGHVRIKIPGTAQRGQSYTLRFAFADGAPDFSTQYDFETASGSVWVQSTPRQPRPSISEEWRSHYFGSNSTGAAEPDADPDRDGMANSAEYVAGTHPLNASSRLAFRSPALETARGVVLRWQTARGRVYTIEASSDLSGASWVPVASELHGDGAVQAWVHRQPGAARFYRLRVRNQFLQTQ